jgi:hypothetical protein
MSFKAVYPPLQRGVVECTIISLTPGITDGAGCEDCTPFDITLFAPSAEDRA